MIRVLKIVLIILSVIVLGGMSYMLFDQFLKGGFSNLPVFALVYSGLIILFSSVNIIYHIKTFRFYRRKEKQNLDKKVSKILWAGTICFSAFLLFLMGNAIYRDTQRYLYSGQALDNLLFTLIFIIPALIGFLEVSLLKKRIKRLKVERETKDEINSIGNLTS